MSMRIKKGDQVIVNTGKDKGKEGEVIMILGDKAVVKGVNISKKHIKNTPNVTQSGIVDKESPISISNVLFVDPESSQAGRVSYEQLDTGKYNRIVKKSKK